MAIKEIQDNINYEDAKYLSISVIARRAKEISKAHHHQAQTSEVFFDPIEAALEDFNRGKLHVYRRNEFTGELDKF